MTKMKNSWNSMNLRKHLTNTRTNAIILIKGELYPAGRSLTERLFLFPSIELKRLGISVRLAGYPKGRRSSSKQQVRNLERLLASKLPC